MTLGEGKDKVYMLLDEHSAGGEIEHDDDLEKKMAYFFDLAQKEVAKVKKIQKTYTITKVSGVTEYSMPSDFVSLYQIWVDDVLYTNKYRWKGRKLVIPEDDESTSIEIEYFAMPATIAEDAEDEYEFELPEDACNCMPYFVAAQHLLPDLVLDYSVYLNMFQMSLSGLSSGLPGDGAALKQRLFRV